MIIQSEYNDFKVTVEVSNFTEKEEYMLADATNLMARALGDPMFKEYCLNYSYEIAKYKWVWLKKVKWTETVKGFYNVNGLSQFQVYEKVMKGEEVLSEDGEDNEADIFLKIDRTDKPGVLGYTYASDIYQYIYSRVFREYGVNTVAGNLCHEWVHKLGFSHKNVPSSRKKHTAPYTIGYYVKYFSDFKEMMDNGLVPI